MDGSSLRRRSNPNFRSNFGAGYVPVDDVNLHHTGIRGKKSCCLCFTLFFLLIIALANAVVTAGLVYYLKITHQGMESVEFIPGGHLLRVLAYANLDSAHLYGMIGGRRDKNISIEGNEAGVFVTHTDGAEVNVDQNRTTITTIDFRVHTPQGKSLFSTQPTIMLTSQTAKNLHAAVVQATVVTGTTAHPDLHLESFRTLDVVGMEGLTVEAPGGKAVLTFNKSANIDAVTGSITLDSQKGSYLNPSMPKTVIGAPQGTSALTYKICVCHPSGRVFAVPITKPDSGCTTLNENKNPCED